MGSALMEDIALYGNEKAYDQLCKKFLSYKEVLAFIMQQCVEEYKGCSAKEIREKCIEGTPEVSSIAVMPDQTNHIRQTAAGTIVGDNIEDGSLSEGTVWFDIRFHASTPDNAGSIGLIINIEAQNRDKPSYPLTKRGIYYCARLLSSQYGKDFTKAHYENLKKVYSIWICTTPAEKRQNSIMEYSIQETTVCGDNPEEKRNYDLLKLIIVSLGEEDKTDSDILRFLDILFSKTLPKEEKIDLLTTEFDFEMNAAMEGDVENMCNLSQGVRNEGIRIGEARGEARGMEIGKYTALAQSIRNLMETTEWPFEQAAAAMKLSPEEQQKCKAILGLAN